MPTDARRTVAIAPVNILIVSSIDNAADDSRSKDRTDRRKHWLHGATRVLTNVHDPSADARLIDLSDDPVPGINESDRRFFIA